MSASPAEPVAPTRVDPVAASASEVIGGPIGRYAAPARHTAGSAWVLAAAVLVGLSSLTVALGVLQKGHCFSRGWSTPDQFWHACYSDFPSSAGLGQAMPYLPGAPHLDQPLISGVLMWLVGLAVPDGSALVRQQWYFALWAVLVTVIVMALVAVTAASVPRSPWRAAHVALSPVLALAGVVSVDLLGVLLASVALWAWGRSRITMAGVFMGLAVSARSYPLVLLVAIGLLAVRSGRLMAWRRFAATALATWVAVSLPWLVVNAEALLSVYRTWWRSGAGYGSPWMIPSLLGRPPPLFQPPPPGQLTALVILGWLAALAVGAFFALSLDRRPTVAEVSLVMLVIVVVTGKTMPVQAALWLVPLIALVGLAWRDHLVWAGFEAAYFLGVWLYIAGLTTAYRGLPPGGYALLTGLRVASWLFVLVQVWRVARSRGPAGSSDPADPGLADQQCDDPDRVVEDAEVDAEVDEVDPLAGPLAGAPDRVLVHLS